MAHRKFTRNDTLGIIAPAGPISRERLDAIQPWLDQHGYRGKIYPGCALHNGYLAGSDEQRLADLHAAFADPEIAAVICVRGGYGSPRLLDKIDWELLRQHPKPFIGYSDLTAIHAALLQLGIPSVHGAMMAVEVIKQDEPSISSLFDLLEGRISPGSLLAGSHGDKLVTLRGGKANGVLFGGNLCLIGTLLGTPWAVDGQDRILFMEDVSEPLYKIDRMLCQLRLSGLLGQVSGIVIGDFDMPNDHARQQLQQLFIDTLSPLNIPVLSGWQSGHCYPNLALPLGCRVELDADQHSLTLLQPFCQ